MDSIPLIILSAFAALGIIFISRILLYHLFSSQLQKSVILIPFAGSGDPIAETLRTAAHWGIRVIAVDLSGSIDGKQYVELGLCHDFLTPEQLGSLYKKTSGGGE